MAIESLSELAKAGRPAFAAGAAYFGPTAPDPAEYTNWFLLTGEWFKWDGSVWFQPIAGSAPASASQKKPYLWA